VAAPGEWIPEAPPEIFQRVGAAGAFAVKRKQVSDCRPVPYLEKRGLQNNAGNQGGTASTLSSQDGSFSFCSTNK